MAASPPPPRELAAQLRASLASLKTDVRASFRLCGRDFGVLGAELVAALERGRTQERASSDALAHERAARAQLETRLAELQGNIRVLCRVRPLPSSPGSSGGEDSDASPDRRRKRVQVESSQALSVFSPVDGALYKSFSFARVFHEQHSQLTVFKEVAPLVRAAVAGHHACVFAYGQTGAGKTHTMQGEGQGLHQRAAELIFSCAAQQQHVYEFQVQVQMVEVYNEEIYDLLAHSSSSVVNSTTTTGTAASGSGGSPSGAAKGCHVGATSMFGNVQANSSTSLEIRHGETGVYLKNVQSVAVPSAKEIDEAVARSKANRAKNDRSNRAHTVLMIDIRRTSKANGDTDTGRLALVDLAGSERLSKTAETPALTVRESQHINKSLAAVGDVLSALLAKEKHIPFRNSKLTHLLQDSLSGSANRTLLIVHVSPRSVDVNETINSLKFASRVSHIQMGKSRRTERAEITRLNGVVANQVSQIQALQEKLTAELELRKKYERRLEEYRHEEHRRRSKGDEARRILQQMQTPSPPELPPPVSARRWSLYTRKENIVNNAQGLNGIENVAENILRGNESSPETAEVRATTNGKPSGISPPTNFSRRLSLSAIDQKSGAPGRTQAGKRKRSSTSDKVRSILKKQRGNDQVVDLTGEDGGDGSVAKQVSFDLSLAMIGSSSGAARELNISAAAPRVPVGGAVRVLAANRSVTGPTQPRRVASTPGKRTKTKSNGWR